MLLFSREEARSRWSSSARETWLYLTSEGILDFSKDNAAMYCTPEVEKMQWSAYSAGRQAAREDHAVDGGRHTGAETARTKWWEKKFLEWEEQPKKHCLIATKELSGVNSFWTIWPLHIWEWAGVHCLLLKREVKCSQNYILNGNWSVDSGSLVDEHLPWWMNTSGNKRTK